MAVSTMTARSNEQGYSFAARVLHWITAVIVIGMIPAGIYMANASPGPTQDLLFHLHRSFGVVLLPIVLARLAYRFTHPPPPLPNDIPAVQRSAAHAVHYALYALLIVQPIVGWIATSAYRAPIPGVLDLHAAADLARGPRLLRAHVPRAPRARNSPSPSSRWRTSPPRSTTTSCAGMPC